MVLGGGAERQQSGPLLRQPGGVQRAGERQIFLPRPGEERLLHVGRRPVQQDGGGGEGPIQGMGVGGAGDPFPHVPQPLGQGADAGGLAAAGAALDRDEIPALLPEELGIEGDKALAGVGSQEKSKRHR